MRRFIDIKPEAGRAFERTKDGDLIVPMAFSSELPAERWWGTEVLDHSEKSIRLDRLRNGASVLFNHDWNDLRGTHEGDSIKVGKDRVLRGDIRLDGATQVGKDTISRVERGFLKKASIGYRIHMIVEQSKKKTADGNTETVERVLDGATFERLIEDLEKAHGRPSRREFQRGMEREFGKPPVERKDNEEEPVYRAMDWEPYENSLVTIPLDDGVGVGRGYTHTILLQDEEEARARAARSQSAVSANNRREPVMEKTQEQLAAEAAEREAARVAQAKRDRETFEAAERDAAEALKRASALDLEKARRRGIETLCTINKLDKRYADMWVGQGLSLDKVADEILLVMEERGKRNPSPASALGLNPGEQKRYSFAKAILAVANQDWSDAGFELECSREVAKKVGRSMDPKNFLVPFEAMQRNVDMTQFDMARLIGALTGKRDLTVATAGAGGFLVGTSNEGFIEILRNRSVAFRMGVRRLSGLRENITVPRQSAAATAFWLANESTAVTESQQTFVQMALTPKNVGAYTEISRQLLLQSSPGAEGIVTDDLAQVVAIAADLAVLNGSGAGGQPTGIIGTAGIGGVTGTSIDYAKVLEFQTDVATANVMPARGGYVTTPLVAALLMGRQRFTSTDTPLWVGNIWDGSVSGFPAMSSNQMPSANMLFGDWQETVVGEWGVLEVSVNPFANFPAGIIGVRAIYSMDVGVRRPFAYSLATAIT